MKSTLPKNLKKKITRNPLWMKGFKSFHFLLGRPLVWMFVAGDKPEMYRITRKNCCCESKKKKYSERKCDKFLRDTCEKFIKEDVHDYPRYIGCPKSHDCFLLPMVLFNRCYGFLILCDINTEKNNILQIISSFHCFLKSQLENLHKSHEIDLIYENLHPRALAMSTMHTVHRIISSSLTITDLIPRLCRFTMQVIKADYTSMYLLDDVKKFLVKRFETTKISSSSVLKQKRIRVATGVFGKIVTTGGLYFKKRCIAVPLIEDDVIGIIVVMRNQKSKPFSKVDLEILRTVAEQAVIAIKNAELFETHEKVVTGSVESISNIIDLTTQHEKTAHSEVFDKLVYEVSKYLKLSTQEQKNIMLASRLLSRGHLGLPEDIRAKKGNLTQKEEHIIKKHPFKAVELIRTIDSLQPIIPIILYHHERYDGKGYPHGLKREEIPLTARIIAVVMTFVAMISRRPYKSAKSIRDAIQEILSLSGRQFDPEVVDAFMAVIQENEVRFMLLYSIAEEEDNGSKKKKSRNKN